MKKNIDSCDKIPLDNSFIIFKNLFTWDEYCDVCGIHSKVKNTFYNSIPPNVNEKDYCLECMRKILDETRRK